MKNYDKLFAMVNDFVEEELSSGASGEKFICGCGRHTATASKKVQIQKGDKAICGTMWNKR